MGCEDALIWLMGNEQRSAFCGFTAKDGGREEISKRSQLLDRNRPK